MTLNDLLLLASVFVLLLLLIRLTASLVRRDWRGFRRIAQIIAIFLATYATALILVSLATPRKILAAGEHRCFDDWCVAAQTVTQVGDNRWAATLEISSRAKRIRQSARDAAAMLEDTNGKLYQPLGYMTDKQLTTFLEPGESFPVQIAFQLPPGMQPAGVVIQHGAFPGLIIIGDTQSFLHRQTLLQLKPE